MLWIVGHVSRLWFFTAKGEPVEHASIHVVPLADGVAQKARKLICNLSKPAVGKYGFVSVKVMLSACITQHLRKTAGEICVRLNG